VTGRSRRKRRRETDKRDEPDMSNHDTRPETWSPMRQLMLTPVKTFQ
jgi:hypothetical protein